MALATTGFHNKRTSKTTIVVLIDPNTARNDWKVGRIVSTYPGGDGLLRVVDVKVADQILKRPVTRLLP